MRLLNSPWVCPFKVGDQVAYYETYGGTVLRITEDEEKWILWTDDYADMPWVVFKDAKDRSGMRLWEVR